MLYLSIALVVIFLGLPLLNRFLNAEIKITVKHVHEVIQPPQPDIEQPNEDDQLETLNESFTHAIDDILGVRRDGTQ